jgi:hypothetical protein
VALVLGNADDRAAVQAGAGLRIAGAGEVAGVLGRAIDRGAAANAVGVANVSGRAPLAVVAGGIDRDPCAANAVIAGGLAALGRGGTIGGGLAQATVAAGGVLGTADVGATVGVFAAGAAGHAAGDRVGFAPPEEPTGDRAGKPDHKGAPVGSAHESPGQLIEAIAVHLVPLRANPIARSARRLRRFRRGGRVTGSAAGCRLSVRRSVSAGASCVGTTIGELDRTLCVAPDSAMPRRGRAGPAATETRAANRPLSRRHVDADRPGRAIRPRVAGRHDARARGFYLNAEGLAFGCDAATATARAGIGDG